MPETNQVMEFEQIVSEACNLISTIRPYLDEAQRCFIAKAYNATVVMAWCAVIARLQFEVEQIGGRPVFEPEYLAEYGSDSSCPDDLKKVEDFKLIRVCLRLGLISQIEEKALDECRKRRNDCAHPLGIFLNAPEVLQYLHEVGRQLLKRSARVPWNRILEIVRTEGAKLTEEQANHIAASIDPPDKAQEVMNRLLSSFLTTDSFEIRTNIHLLWPRLGERLASKQRAQLMKRLGKELAGFLGVRVIERGPNVEEHPIDEIPLIELDPTDIADLIFWQDIENDSWYQQWIYEYLISEYERFARERAGRGIDAGILRHLCECAPDEFRERCKRLRETVLLVSL